MRAGLRRGLRWAGLLLPLLGGCATTGQAPALYEPAPPAIPEARPASPGSLYPEGGEASLFTDLKARRVGDILTIVLVERTTATKSSATTTSKEHQVDLPEPTLLGNQLSTNGPGGKDLSLGAKVESKQSFAGKGDSSLSNKLEGRITVTVARVLANGNLVVRGQKRLRINQGDEYVRFYGIVRPVDIRADNTVLSTQVADARIAYEGRGALAGANTMGWLGRFFNSRWWPF
ncbi:MAG: flagellar basal body L-ring protein FlgH [Gammaproteobacteria bacterium]|nr:MAG: flagellar basal body L-ring protein FlgH [Gammaproteobacteria bacterium]